MSEIIELILRLSDDVKLIKAYLQTLRKSKAEQFQESWIDGQDVMQALHISKRTLQSLRESGGSFLLTYQWQILLQGRGY